MASQRQHQVVSIGQGGTEVTLLLAPHMGAEVEEGNVEYKYTLADLTEEQLAHRITQLNWRLNEGNNEALYKVGVRDDGYPVGLSDEDLSKSLASLTYMASSLQCTMAVMSVMQGSVGKVAEVLFRRLESDVIAPPQIDVAVAGDSNSGKSTLIGVLVHGQLDNGRGSARMQILKHNHELASGHTSCISHHVLFFGDEGQVLKSSTLASELLNSTSLVGSAEKILPSVPPSVPRAVVSVGADIMSRDSSLPSNPIASADEAEVACASSVGNGHGRGCAGLGVIGDSAAASAARLRALSDEDVLRETMRSVSFIDLAGREKYLKTAFHGLIGRAPQFCLLAVSSAIGSGAGRCGNGISDSISTVTREHLALASAMKLRLIMAVTKTDLVPTVAKIEEAVAQCVAVLAACGRQGIPIRSQENLLALLSTSNIYANKQVPVFVTSSVSGAGLSLLKQYLFLVEAGTGSQSITSKIADPTDRAGELKNIAEEDVVILLLDHFRLDPPQGEGGLMSEESLSPSAAIGRMNTAEAGTSSLDDTTPSSQRTGSGSVLVLFGSVKAGTVRVGDQVLYGPDDAGQFSPIRILSIHVNHVSLREVTAGRCACFAVSEVSSASPSAADISHHQEASSPPQVQEDSARLKIDLCAVDSANYSPATATCATEVSDPTLRAELRICHKTDPRRRRLRVADPEHPSNLIVQPLSAHRTGRGGAYGSASSLNSSTSGEASRNGNGPLGWQFRSGMVLLSTSPPHSACIEFEANILVLNHPTSICVSYEPVVHGLGSKQCAKIVSMRKLVGGEDMGPVESIKNGERALCRFRFLYRPEYLPVGTNIVLREGRTRAIGIVTGTTDMEHPTPQQPKSQQQHGVAVTMSASPGTETTQ